RALCTDEAMRIPPRATAVRVGMVISSSSRDRTRQFFSARRDAGWACGAWTCPLPSACPAPSGPLRPKAGAASAPSLPNADPVPPWSPAAPGAAEAILLLRDCTRHDLSAGCHGELGANPNRKTARRQRFPHQTGGLEVTEVSRALAASRVR